MRNLLLAITLPLRLLFLPMIFVGMLLGWLVMGCQDGREIATYCLTILWPSDDFTKRMVRWEMKKEQE